MINDKGNYNGNTNQFPEFSKALSFLTTVLENNEILKRNHRAKTSSEMPWCLIWMVSPVALWQGMKGVLAVTVPVWPPLPTKIGKGSIQEFPSWRSG